jgi:hypothetical protein
MELTQDHVQWQVVVLAVIELRPLLKGSYLSVNVVPCILKSILTCNHFYILFLGVRLRVRSIPVVMSDICCRIQWSAGPQHTVATVTVIHVTGTHFREGGGADVAFYVQGIKFSDEVLVYPSARQLSCFHLMSVQW